MLTPEDTSRAVELTLRGYQLDRLPSNADNLPWVYSELEWLVDSGLATVLGISVAAGILKVRVNPLIQLSHRLYPTRQLFGAHLGFIYLDITRVPQRFQVEWRSLE